MTATTVFPESASFLIDSTILVAAVLSRPVENFGDRNK
jgi:hypothetical protein